MRLEVTFRGLKAKDEVRRRGEALFKKLERFLDPAAEGKLMLSAEHGVTVSELTVSSNGTIHKATNEDEDLRTSIDRTFHTIETSLRRSKERKVDRWHRHRTGEVDGFVPEADDGDEVEAEEEVGEA